MKLRKILFYFLVILLVLIFGLYLFRNLIVKVIIEKGGQKIFKAKVEVKDIDVSIFSAKMAWKELSIANKEKPMYNLFETGECIFDISFLEIVSGNIIIDELKVANVKINSKRTSSGRIKENPKDGSSSFIYATNYLNQQKQAIPVLNYKIINTDSLLSVLEFETPLKVDSLAKRIEDSRIKWKATLKNKEYKDKAKEIEKKFKKIDFNNLEDASEEVIELYNASNDLFSDVKKEHKRFKEDLEMLKKSNEVVKWAKQDYQKAMDVIKFPNTKGQDLGKILFGDSVTNLLLKCLAIIQSSRVASGVDQPEKESDSKPGFWIKHLEISFILEDGIFLEGKISDLSFDQKKTKKPIFVYLIGSSPKMESIKIDLNLNYTKIVPVERLVFNISKLKIGKYSLNQNVLPPTIKHALASFQGNITSVGKKIDVTAQIDLSDLTFGYNYPKNVSQKMRDIAQLVGNSTKKISIGISYKQINKEGKLKINSNIDDIIKNALFTKFNQEKELLKERINKKISSDKYKKKIANLMNGLENDIESLLLNDKPISTKDRSKMKKKLESEVLNQAKKIVQELKVEEKAKEIFRKLKF